MQYFVTGATGFTGRRLVKTCWRGAALSCTSLLRKGVRRQGARTAAVLGVVSRSRGAGVRRPDEQEARRRQRRREGAEGPDRPLLPPRRGLRPSADEESQIRANIDGTRDAVEFAKAIDAKHFHHVVDRVGRACTKACSARTCSRRPRSGPSVLRMTKHESEDRAQGVQRCPGRSTARRWWWATATGEMDKVDGPYYFFKLIQRMRQILPPWMPSVGLEGGRVNIVPVDFVVALDQHQPPLPRPAAGASTWSIRWATASATCWTSSAKAAHAPKMNLFVNAGAARLHPQEREEGLMAWRRCASCAP